MYTGSKWWKFDFHTHTPASIDYRDQNRSAREWLLDHMEQEIDCVAVTDHNSGQWIDELKTVSEEMKSEGVVGYRDIVIFPGVEITINGNIHVLALFDPSKDSDHISRVLSRCEYDGTPGSSDTCTIKSYTQVIDVIHDMHGLAIPAHVDQPCGLFVEPRGNTLKVNLEAKGILAIQLCDANFQKPPLYIESKVNYTEVCGSDSHDPSHVGSSTSWVKMEHPNLAALRLALHDGEDGVIRDDAVSDNPNDLKNRFFIRRVTIENGTKAGRSQPLDIPFSPWLNTIIGGRGSGKSSIIEYMRFPLDKTNELSGHVGEEFNNFNKIPSERGKVGMLQTNTKIRVELTKDAREIALTWENNKITEEHKDLQNNLWVTKDETSDIDARFPIRFFSQKQLFILTEDPNSIIKTIDEQYDKKKWKEKYDELTEKWFENRSNLRAIDSKITSKNSLNSELDDIKAKMKVFEESGYKDLLENYQKSQGMKNRINDEHTKIQSYTANLISVLEEMPSISFSPEELDLMDSESKETIIIQMGKLKQLESKLVTLVEEFTAFEKDNKGKFENLPFQKECQLQQTKYNDFVEALKQTGEKNPNAYGELVNRKRELEQKKIDIEKLEKQYEELKKENNTLYIQINTHQRKLRDYRKDVIIKWQGTNQQIRMHLEVMGNIGEAEKSMRNLIRKLGNEYSKDILEKDEDGNAISGFIYDLVHSDDPWKLRENIIKNIITADEASDNGFSKYFVKHLSALDQKTPEDIDRLILWYPEDKITLGLINSSGREEDIETGSAGQRTAAMLSLMLLLDDTPLIIDQPEEDLDTKRITDLVVKGLRDFKLKQQVIVITHNPNIPVNGAAENIIHMNFNKGQIKKQVSGALQNRDIREAICEVMEGGKKALDNRYYRISKALE